MLDINTILFAITGGILPALIWLFFWLKEDSSHPEPKKIIFLTFVFGMLSVPLALGLQLFINKFIFGDISIEGPLILSGVLIIFCWALIEETCKYLAAIHGGLKRKEHDEPLDDMIYMITAALGFSALENTLFLFAPLLSGDTELAIVTSNFRFIGATLLHVSTAAIIGAFRAYSHFKLDSVQKRYTFSGFVIAVALHVAFNLFIINSVESTFIAFSGIWIVIIIIILIFEHLKNIHVEEIKNNSDFKK